MRTDPLLLAARRIIDGRTEAARYPHPGDLARALVPRTVSTPALRLLDRHLEDVAAGRTKRLIWSMPPQEGKPVAVRAMILMGDGSRQQLSNVQVGDTVITHLGRPKQVTAVYEQGTLPVVTIATHAGRTVTAALDHPFLTPAGWVNAGDLTVGDCLAAVPAPRTETQSTLSAEAARLLGYFIGDGSTTANGRALNAAITCADDTEAQDIQRCADALGFKLALAAPGKKAGLAKRYLLSKGVRPWLRAHGMAGCTSWTKRVPREVFTQTNEVIAEFIGAYFACDGTVSRRGGARPDARIEFNSVSRDLLTDVQHLLLRLGIASTLRAKNTTMNGMPYVSWRLLMRRQDDVAKFRALVPVHHEKAAVLGEWPLRRTEFDPQYFSDPITEITTGENQECRCLTVEEDHTFTAEDLVVHNSQRVSRTFPAWLLNQDPDLRIAIASYETNTARRWGRAIRNDITANPDKFTIRVRQDTSAAHEWELQGHDGGVYSVGLEGALTGRPVDILIIDDPIKGRAQAESPIIRERAWDFWTDSARTRFSPNTAVIVVLTRWHEDDLAGRLLTGPSAADWLYVNVPAQAEAADDPLGREIGEYLLSARGREATDWEDTKRDVGARTWTSLYQGRPAPADGGLFKRSNWSWYSAPRAYAKPDGTMHVQGADEVIQSWDMAFKDTKSSDFVVGQVWARYGAQVYLLDQIHDRLDFPATCRAVTALSAKWPQAHAKLVEDKANGPAVIAQLHSTIAGMIPITPKDSKFARASAVSPFQESGNVFLPDPAIAPWIDAFVVEHSSFPNGTHDDQVDGTTQALLRLLGGQSSAAQAMDWLQNYRTG